MGFEVAAGECYGLLGPNGAGKTTTISLICGLLDGDGGEVTVERLPVDAALARCRRRRIGYVPQDIALYPDLSARENLRFFGRLYGLKGEALDAQRRRRARDRRPRRPRRANASSASRAA